MKFEARISSGTLQRQFARLIAKLEPAALDAAADALAKELEHARHAEGLHEPLLREGDARGRSVGANDPDSIAREFGSPTEPPAPWLAPVLPAARAPMRAAALARVRDVVAVHAGKRKPAVARALSRTR